ncbi:MAG: ATP-binding protein [Chromatiales bacterium]|nr:ATP-binding protein [Chromatiales bacterium]
MSDIELPKDPEQLLALALDLLEFKRFRVTRIFEGSGPDGGRDAEALTYGEDESGTSYVRHWWIELKYRGRGNLPIADLPTKLHNARVKGVRFFLLITNVPVSAKNYEDLESIAREYHIEFRVWDKQRLIRLLREVDKSRRPNRHERVPLMDREAEVGTLETFLTAGDYSVVLVRGTGGVGKSALARFLMYRLGQTYAHGLIDSRLKDDVGFSFQMLADAFLKQGSRTPFAFSSGQRLRESERLQLFLEHCREERTLLVLDNFEDMLDAQGKVCRKTIETLISHFLNHDTRGSVLLITSRVGIADLRFSSQEAYQEVPLQGWDIDFVVDEYLPVADYLSTRLDALGDDAKAQHERLRIFKGNPLALKIANQLCAHYSFRDMVALLPKDTDPAQALIEAFSHELADAEISALHRFAQFARPMTNAEITRFVTSAETLTSLTLKQLVEAVDSEGGQFQLHPITIERFSLIDQPAVRRSVVRDLVSAIEASVAESKDGVDASYNHFLMRQVVRMSIQVGDLDVAGEVLSRIGTRAVSMGDVEFLNFSLGAVSGQIDARLDARLAKVRGHVADLLGDFDAAAQIYQDMLLKGESLDDPWVRAAALNGLGTMARHQGRTEEAIRIYRESLALRQASGDEVGQSNSLHNIGASFLELHELGAARENLSAALKLRKRLGDRFRMSATQLYLAECDANAGDLDKAWKGVRSAQRIKEHFNDVVGLLWCRLLMVKVALLDPQRDVELLEENLAWSTEVAARLKKPRDIMLAGAFNGVYALLTDPEGTEAWGHLVEARKLAERLHNVEQVRWIKQTLQLALDGDAPEKTAESAFELVRNLKI